MASGTDPNSKPSGKKAPGQEPHDKQRSGQALGTRKGPWTFVLDDPLQRAQQFALNLREALDRTMVGQAEARAAMAAFAFQAVLSGGGSCRRNRALLLGPSGCGKTLASRVFAQAWTDQLEKPAEGGVLEVEMSRYKEWSSAVDLFGDKAKPGVIGGYVADHPAAVILVNGFEQAHENVLASWPAILDGEQRLLANGKTIDFRRIIWLLCSTEGKALWGRTSPTNTAFCLDLSAVLNSPQTDRWGERKPDQVPEELVARLAEGTTVLFRPAHGHHHFDLLIRTCTATWS